VQGKPSQIFKKLALEVRLLYQKDKQQTIDDFILPFGGALSADNRWVVKAEMIPWVLPMKKPSSRSGKTRTCNIS